MKNIVKMIAVMAIACLITIKASNKQNVNISDVVLANVEALAELENDNPIVVITCSRTCEDGIGQCWKTFDEYSKYCTRTDDTSNFCSCAK